MTPIDRIHAAYRSATPDEIHQGTAWYPTARYYALAMSAQYPVTFTQAAAVLAALSPRKEWNLNVRLADHACRTRSPQGQTNQQLTKVRTVLSLKDPDPATILPILKGPKTQAFFLNIHDPTDPDPVTVDRHAYTVVHPRRPISKLNNKGEYERIADLYRKAADALDLLPSELQAITWLTERRRKGH